MVTDSDNRIRLAPVSEGVHRPLWSVMRPCGNSFDKALERAWQRRSELSSMGVHAAQRIRELTPEDACLEFTERLLVVFS